MWPARTLHMARRALPLATEKIQIINLISVLQFVSPFVVKPFLEIESACNLYHQKVLVKSCSNRLHVNIPTVLYISRLWSCIGPLPALV